MNCFNRRQPSTLNCTHGGSEYLYSERSRGFRRNPIRENEGQHREEIYFFVETTNRLLSEIRKNESKEMYSPILQVIAEIFFKITLKDCRCVRQVGLLSTAPVDS